MSMIECGDCGRLFGSEDRAELTMHTEYCEIFTKLSGENKKLLELVGVVHKLEFDKKIAAETIRGHYRVYGYEKQRYLKELLQVIYSTKFEIFDGEG